MNFEFKKSDRKDLRVRLDEFECQISLVSKNESYVGQLLDIAMGGLSFVLKSKRFSARNLVRIQLQSPNGKHIALLGMVTAEPKTDPNALFPTFRYSVKFERKMSEKEFKALLSNFHMIRL